MHQEALADFCHVPVKLEGVGHDVVAGRLDVVAEERGDRSGQELAVEEGRVHVPRLEHDSRDVVTEIHIFVNVVRL